MASKLPPEIYSHEALEEVASSFRGPTAVRNRALLAVAAGAGLRCAELLALQPHDVLRTERAARIHVRRGKGAKQRVAILRPEALPALHAWIDERAARGIGNDAPLFCSLDGSEIGTSAVRMLLARVRRHGGIAQRLHAHGLRHTHAIELQNDRVPPKMIQSQLGHSSLAITDRYLSHVSPEQVEAFVLQASK